MTKIDLASFKATAEAMKDQKMPVITITPKLCGGNYVDWKFNLENQLISVDWFQFLTEDYEDEVYEDAKFKQYDRYLLAQISSNVSQDIRKNFYFMTSGREAYSFIKKMFEGTSHVKSLRLFRQLSEIVINHKGSDFNATISKFNNFVNGISNLFPSHDDKIWIGLLLSLLPDNLSHLSGMLKNN